MIYTMAWRNIWRSKMRSIVIMLSIALGLFAGIAVLALYKGMMKARIRTVIDAEVGHLQVHEPDFRHDYEPSFTLSDGDALLDSIRLMPSVAFASARSITQGMLSTATGTAGVQINGVIPEEEYRVSQLEKKIVEGKPFDATRKNEAMIGKKLADKMNLRPGQKLVLTFTDTAGTMVSGAFRVAAVYQSANAPLDERNVYLRQSDLNPLLGLASEFHEIAVLLNRDEDLDQAQDTLQATWPGYAVESWKELAPETDLMVNTTNQLSYILMGIIMFALAFGIVNTMLMAVMERTREIGMMVALGTTRLRIFMLVLTETVYLTLAGAPVGFLTGWLITRYYTNAGLDISGMGEEMMRSFGYNTLIYPEFPAEKFPAVVLIVAATALCASLLPAMKALRLRPIEALRQ